MITPDEVLDLARAKGFLMVLGEPRGFSEWGSTYSEFVNGVQCLGLIKQSAPLSDARLNCERCFDAFLRFGDDVIVWRIMPEVCEFKGEKALYFRMHSMKSADLGCRLDMTPLRAKEAT